jgi:hypothetical protein
MAVFAPRPYEFGLLSLGTMNAPRSRSASDLLDLGLHYVKKQQRV